MDRKILGILCFLFFFLALCRPNSQEKAPQKPGKEGSVQKSFFGSIVFQSNADGDDDIYLLTAQGPTQLTHNTWNDEFPVWSPDGKRIAFSANPRGDYDLFTMSADGRNITPVARSSADEREPSWCPDGQNLVFTRESKAVLKNDVALYRVSLKTGRAVKLIEDYSRVNAIPAVSPQGNLVAFTGKRPIGWDVAVYDSKLDEVKFLDNRGKSCRARFSPDGAWLAYVSSLSDGKGDIWLMRPNGDEKSRLTERDGTYDYFPAWSPDGRQIVFCSSKQHKHEGDWALYIVDVQSGLAELLFDGPGSDVFPDWH